MAAGTKHRIGIKQTKVEQADGSFADQVHVVNSSDSPATTSAASNITVTTASTQILPANPARRSAVMYVNSGGPVYVSSGVATTNDFPVPTGGAFEISNTAALNGIVSSGTADVRVWEEA